MGSSNLLVMLVSPRRYLSAPCIARILRARLWVESRKPGMLVQADSDGRKADLGVAGHAPEAVDAGVRHPVQVICHGTAGHFALQTTSG